MLKNVTCRICDITPETQEESKNIYVLTKENDKNDGNAQ